MKLSLFPFAIIVGCPGVSKTKSRTCDYRKWKSVWSAQDSSHFPSAINRRAKQAWGNSDMLTANICIPCQKVKRLILHPQSSGAFLWLCSMKWPEVLCCYTPRWDTNPPLHLVRFPDSSPVWVKGGIVSEECLAQEPNTMSRTDPEPWSFHM